MKRTPEHAAIIKALRSLIFQYKKAKLALKTDRKEDPYWKGLMISDQQAIRTVAYNWIHRKEAQK